MGEKCYIPEMAGKSLPPHERIIELFFEQKYHNTFNDWFEEFLEITKIKNFDRNLGLDFYKFPNNNTIMMYTLEKINDNKEYITKKLGIKNNLKNVNNSRNRKYDSVYNKVKQTITYPKKYVDDLLNTKVMRLFYDTKEIDYFFSKYKIEP